MSAACQKLALFSSGDYQLHLSQKLELNLLSRTKGSLGFFPTWIAVFLKFCARRNRSVIQLEIILIVLQNIHQHLFHCDQFYAWFVFLQCSSAHSIAAIQAELMVACLLFKVMRI